jgi:folate-binding protein YgfZ
VLDGGIPATWPDEGVAAHYGDPVREQRAIARDAALVDRSNRGVLRITGPDRLSLLHNLTTQDLLNLPPGATAQALILSPSGHVEHHLTLTDSGEATWLHVEPGTATELAAFLESMRFMLRVEVTDVSAEYAVLTVAGPGAAAHAARVSELTVAGTTGPCWIDLVIPRGAAGQVELTPAGTWAFDALRIEARVPRLHVDTDHKTLPHEAGWIGTAVHLNKGCYRGQETVARVQNLGHPPRRLVFLHLDGSADRLPARGAPITLKDGTQVGFAGSSARHHELGPIGLGMIKRTAATDAELLADGVAAGQEVIVSPDAGGAAADVVRRSGLARAGLARPGLGARRPG